ncbi:MAG TPA: helix-turn-helix domain-containing protein [Pseudonocardiaceae bacterium]|jgi:hypothetical protein|nr:helix-turn-helix domain-containing protein [Pseudonocardiaceae bacterium]
MAAVSLSELLDRVGPTVVRVVCAPRGLDHEVGDPEPLDLADPSPTSESALLLGIGLLPDDPRIAEAVQVAAGHGAAALVLKCRDRSTERLSDLAERFAVTILDAGAELSWRRLEALCAAASASAAGPVSTSISQVHGGDLFSLANAVAAIVGGAVAIMDTNEVIVAYSTVDGQGTDDTRRRGILGRRVPEDALPAFLSPAVWRSDSVVRVKRPGDLDRLAVVVRAGAEVLGSLWVVVADDSDTAQRDAALLEAALSEAAKLAALQMLRLRRHADEEQDRRDRALRAALDGQPDVDLTFPGCLLTLATANDHDTDAGPLGLRLQDLATVAAATFGLTVATTLLGEYLHVLVSVPRGGRRQAMVFAEHLLRRVGEALRKDYFVVAGAENTSADQVRGQRVDNEGALAHLGRIGAVPGLVDINGVLAEVVLDRVVGLVGRRPDLRSGIAERIVAHDAAKETDYARTLLTYLRAFGDIAAASATLHVHQNTLRHRLHRAEELFAIELNRPERLLLLWLELAGNGLVGGFDNRVAEPS